jgi:Na+/alanine symporter
MIARYGVRKYHSKISLTIGDIGVGLMAWFNIIAILLLQNRF